MVVDMVDHKHRGGATLLLKLQSKFAPDGVECSERVGCNRPFTYQGKTKRSDSDYLTNKGFQSFWLYESDCDATAPFAGHRK
jgi:hypothetical protein